MMILEYIGYWWLPSNPSVKLPGIMKVSDEDGICLELLGTFRSITSLEINSHDDCEIILGFTNDGKFLTLIESRNFNFVLPSLGITTQKYQVNSFFIGVHFSKKEDIRFFKLSIEYTYLPTWVYSGTPKFLEEWNQDSSENSFADSIVKNMNAPVLEAKTSRGKISILPHRESSTDPLELIQKKNARISIDLLNDLSMNECYLDFVYPLQNLLTLATNQNNFVINLTVFSRNGTKSPNQVELEELPIQFISKVTVQSKPQRKFSGEILFSLKDIENELALYIQQWLNLNEKVKHICDIYFGIKYAEFMYEEQRFLSVMQALESYHRIKFSNEQVSQEKHKNRLQEIHSKVPDCYLDWLKEKLSFSNEPSLKNRIEELVKCYEGVIQPLIKNSDKFIARVKNTRNYFTHYDVSLKEKYAQGDELFRLTQILSFLLRACLLSELGCSSERCVDLLCKNSEYKYTAKEIQKASFQW